MKAALLSLVSPTVLVAIIAVIGAYVTARAALADVTLKRRLETARRFTELAEIANNTKGAAGLYEQIAALELVASFGRSEPHLRSAARAVLEHVSDLSEAQPGTARIKVSAAARKALARVPDHEKRIR